MLRTLAADNAPVSDVHEASKTSVHTNKTETVNHKRIVITLTNLPEEDTDQLLFLMLRGCTFYNPHADTTQAQLQEPLPQTKNRVTIAMANYQELNKPSSVPTGLL